MSTASAITNSKIVTPKPGQEFRTGAYIPFSYNFEYNPALYLPPTVDILLQKEGENFAVELASGLSADGDNVDNGLLSYQINLASFANANLGIGNYKLITIEHDTQKIVFRDGRLTTRQVTGDQDLKIILNLGPGPVIPNQEIPLEPGPVIISQDGSS